MTAETPTIMRAARTILNYRGGTMSSAVELAHDLQDAGVIAPEGLRWEYAVEASDGDLLDLNDDAYSDVETLWTWHRTVAEEVQAERGGTLVRRLAGPTEPTNQETPND